MKMSIIYINLFFGLFSCANESKHYDLKEIALSPEYKEFMEASNEVMLGIASEKWDTKAVNEEFLQSKYDFVSNCDLNPYEHKNIRGIDDYITITCRESNAAKKLNKKYNLGLLTSQEREDILNIYLKEVEGIENGKKFNEKIVNARLNQKS